MTKNEYLEKAISMIKALHIPVSIAINPDVVVNERATKIWGRCKRNPNKSYDIEINIRLLAEANDDAIIEIMLHEVLHTCPDCLNHGPLWKQYAKEVNKAYGINISRTSSAEALGVERKYKYHLQCENCGGDIYRQNKSDMVKYPNFYHCAKCGGNLKKINY